MTKPAARRADTSGADWLCGRVFSEETVSDFQPKMPQSKETLRIADDSGCQSYRDTPHFSSQMNFSHRDQYRLRSSLRRSVKVLAMKGAVKACASLDR
jgi:hypothetical protein